MHPYSTLRDEALRAKEYALLTKEVFHSKLFGRLQNDAKGWCLIFAFLQACAKEKRIPDIKEAAITAMERVVAELKKPPAKLEFREPLSSCAVDVIGKWPALFGKLRGPDDVIS